MPTSGSGREKAKFCRVSPASDWELSLNWNHATAADDEAFEGASSAARVYH